MALPACALATANFLPTWGFMWALAFAVFAGCKWLTWWTAKPGGFGWRSFAYLTLWPGMDARAFLDEDRRPTRPTKGEWLFALAKTLSGAGLIWGVVRFVPDPLMRGWVGMMGLIFLLHFGGFHLLALGWHRCGVDARPLMRWPVAATSLGDFWGERWNRGFNDIAVRHVFKPLLSRWGVVAATLAVFLVSGLVHDLVISVPARGGYGLPTLYFLIQGLGLLAERRFNLRHGWRGWLFTMVVVAGPVGLLFPPVFIERVMLPFFQAIGAL